MSSILEPPKFGTEGWRAVMGTDFSVERVRLCAAAVARLIAADGGAVNGVVVGWDTRRGSQRYAATTTDELLRSGLDVHIFDRPAPTPACSRYAKHHKMFGIMITASHNPAEWNGFKVKSDHGAPLSPTKIGELERHITNLFADSATASELAIPKIGKNRSPLRFNPLPEYLDSCADLVDLRLIEKAKFNLVVDSMHGCGGGNLSRLLAKHATVTELRDTPDPAFPNMRQPEPTEANLRVLADTVVDRGADLGIAFDGDADRLGVVDKSGRYLSTLDVFSLLTYHQLANRRQLGTVVCTLTMSAMVDVIGRHFGVPVIRTPVGFKHIAPQLLGGRCVIGGEESGGYAFRDHIADRDGLASALMLLEMVAQSGKSPSEMLSELRAQFGEFKYARRDIEIASGASSLKSLLKDFSPIELAGEKVASRIVEDGLKLVLESGAWVACRLSGTEPLMRIYAETLGDKPPRVLIDALTKVFGAEGGTRTHTP